MGHYFTATTDKDIDFNAMQPLIPPKQRKKAFLPKFQPIKNDIWNYIKTQQEQKQKNKTNKDKFFLIV